MSTRKNNTSGMLAAAADGITRRDFLDGIAIAIGGAASGELLPRFIAAAVAEEAAAQDAAGYYPPTLTGLRGSHPGSFETAHALRDADFWQHAGAIAATGEDYDLVVVGGGISGLAAAHFYRARRPDARILILDNHDDVGGHAKRNEFGLAGRLALMNGGTYAIDTPRPYSAIADGLLRTLGVDPVALTKKCADENFYAAHGLARGIFFDRETFGADKLVVARKGAAWRDILAAAPLPDKARDDIVRIEEGKTDYFPGLSSAEKKARLARMSYRDFLRDVVKAGPAAIAVYQARSHGEWGVGADAVSALDVWAFDFPGFQGLKLEPGPAPHMGYTASGYAEATSPPSPSIAGRTATPTNTIRCSIRTGRRARRRMSSAAHASDASRLPIQMPALPPIPTRRSIKPIAPCRSCYSAATIEGGRMGCLQQRLRFFQIGRIDPSVIQRAFRELALGIAVGPIPTAPPSPIPRSRRDRKISAKLRQQLVANPSMVFVFDGGQHAFRSYYKICGICVR